jgi:Tol biopolymer transport system component
MPLIQDNYNNGNPSWSPDNTEIVFGKGGHEFLTGEIYKMSANGTNQVNLTNNNVSDSDPEWSPDGNKIVFVSFRNSDFNIFVMDADGANEMQLTYAIFEANSPTWSPDGTKIAYINTYDGIERITIMNANGTNPVEIYTTSDLTLSGLTWSPNGDKLAFSSREEGDINSENIFTLSINGSGLKQLTIMPNSSSPRWSPDGTQIAFASNREDGFIYDIYIMDAGGGNQQNITNFPTNHDVGPGWSR